MNKIITNKKWQDVMPADAVNTLTDVLDAHRAHTFTVTGNQISHQHGGIFFYGGNSEKRKAAAALAGAHTGQEVYQVNLPEIVSKYLGETEKNVATIFDTANKNNWLLFFDEADSLFNKRTEVKDSHDRYANNAIGYLMEQIQQHKSPVIVGCNDQQPPKILQYFRIAVQFTADNTAV